MAKETPFDRARDFVEEKIDQTRDVLGEGYGKARADFDDVASELKKNAKTAAKRLEKDYGYIWDDVRRYVRDNPGTSVAISVGVGFLLGFLLRGDD
jgi:ElaB/YqjD/DUF883 family membrane-anchored ribosome-binding protein